MGSLRTIGDVIERWRERQAEFSRWGAHVDGAKLLGELLSDLEAVEHSGTPVSLSIAAAHSGYSADSLSRLIRSGKLTNYGRKHAPRVRLSECPTKPRLAVPGPKLYNPDADARSLVELSAVRRKQGAS